MAWWLLGLLFATEALLSSANHFKVDDTVPEGSWPKNQALVATPTNVFVPEYDLKAVKFGGAAVFVNMHHDWLNCKPNMTYITTTAAAKQPVPYNKRLNVLYELGLVEKVIQDNSAHRDANYNTTHALVLQIRGLKASFLPCLFNKTRAFCDGRAYLKPLIPHVKLINSMITLERGALHYFAKVAWGNSALYTSFFAGRLTSGPQEKALLARIRKVALAIITDQEAVDQNAVKIQRMIRQLHARVRDGKFQMKLPTDAIPINSQVDLNPASDLSGAITIRNGQWAHLLSNGIVMPSKIYSGAHFRDRNNEFKLFSEALKAGWRHFDVAQDYFPAETVLGRVIANSTVPRSSIFITDKLSYPKDYTRARAVILGQMKQLKVDYIDCYMLYAPGHTLAAEKAAWRDMEALYHEGKIKSLGVSEFDVVKMKRLLSYAKVKPHVLQNHFNMFLPGAHFWSHQPDGLFELCKKHGIAFTSRRMLAYSDMLHMKPMLEPHLIPLMAKYKKTAAQILYRWSMHIGVGVVSKTEVVARMKEDLETLDWQLDEADVRQIREIGAYARPAQEATLNKQKTLKWIKEMSDLKEESQRRVS